MRLTKSRSMENTDGGPGLLMLVQRCINRSMHAETYGLIRLSTTTGNRQRPMSPMNLRSSRERAGASLKCVLLLIAERRLIAHVRSRMVGVSTTHIVTKTSPWPDSYGELISVDFRRIKEAYAACVDARRHVSIRSLHVLPNLIDPEMKHSRTFGEDPFVSSCMAGS
jgi:hypothetical protein